ncbi:MAG: hypothetical protein WA322_21200 [Pseudolabrys sp.]
MKTETVSIEEAAELFTDIDADIAEGLPLTLLLTVWTLKKDELSKVLGGKTWAHFDRFAMRAEQLLRNISEESKVPLGFNPATGTTTLSEKTEEQLCLLWRQTKDQDVQFH